MKTESFLKECEERGIDTKMLIEKMKRIASMRMWKASLKHHIGIKEYRGAWRVFDIRPVPNTIDELIAPSAGITHVIDDEKIKFTLAYDPGDMPHGYHTAWYDGNGSIRLTPDDCYGYLKQIMRVED